MGTLRVFLWFIWLGVLAITSHASVALPPTEKIGGVNSTKILEDNDTLIKAVDTIETKSEHETIPHSEHSKELYTFNDELIQSLNSNSTHNNEGDLDYYLEDDLIHPVESERLCPDEMFQCADGSCMPETYRCDGMPECPDGSDEVGCYHAKACESSEFDCGSNCIPPQWLCDGEVDCPSNAADESDKLCHNFNCKSDQFTCHQSPRGNVTSSSRLPVTCIPLNWVCDAKHDCDDGSDEASCNATCTSEQFTCADGKCVPLLWRCDGDADDCDDGSDEVGCPPRECAAHEEKCPDGKCVKRNWFCDGSDDCDNGWDEKNCGNVNTTSFRCGPSEVRCGRSMICVQRAFLCDGDRDCPSGEDESPRRCAPEPCAQGQFRCAADGACVPQAATCNGFRECVDGSDEEGCGVSKCSHDTEFECLQGVAPSHNTTDQRCIAMSLVCDGTVDCVGGTDESPPPLGACGHDECSEANGGCAHGCVDTRAGRYCTCKPGFKLINETVCEDINECASAGVCSQVCVNLRGSFKCECVEGYAKDTHDGTRCKATEGHASLLFADYFDIRKISLDHQEVTAIVNATNGSTALDFVFKTGMIFWADDRDRCIYKAPIDEGHKREVVVRGDVTNTDGLAVDWIYNHIYWTNALNNTVEVSDFNGDMRKTLFHRTLDKPRAIALFPAEGWLFWTNWGANARIERAGMDGTNRKEIVSRDIRWPNGLVVDLVLRRLYWVDSKKHTIETSDFAGKHRRVVLFSRDALPHPFSISVFEDRLYWTDWMRGAILSANKFTGRNLTVISHGHANPKTVHVYHSYRQSNGSNGCTPLNGLCTHLCLPAPLLRTSRRVKITCACPDGLELMADKVTCERPERVTAPHSRITEPILAKASFGAQPPLSNPTAAHDGSVAVAAILAAAAVLCITSAASLMAYRFFRRRAAHSLNFDNPVYKKTTTNSPPSGVEDPSVHLHASSGGGGTRKGHNKSNGVASSDDVLEPLTGGPRPPSNRASELQTV